MLMLFLCSFGTCSSSLGYFSQCFAEADGGFTLQERGFVHKLPQITVPWARTEGGGPTRQTAQGAHCRLPRLKD